jgi:hypothetical protein
MGEEKNSWTTEGFRQATLEGVLLTPVLGDHELKDYRPKGTPPSDRKSFVLDYGNVGDPVVCVFIPTFEYEFNFRHRLKKGVRVRVSGKHKPSTAFDPVNIMQVTRLEILDHARRPPAGRRHLPKKTAANETKVFGALISATRDALRRAVIADPAAVKELALDLAEISLLGAKQEGEGSAIQRAARTMVRLHYRFNGDGDPADADTQPLVLGADENGDPIFSQVGVWVLVLRQFEEIESFNDPMLTDVRRWLIEFREQILTSNSGGR